MGLFFDDYKKKISKTEFEELRGHLASNDFTHEEIEKVAGIFNADLNEEREEDMGIDEKEIKVGLDWMRSHLDSHRISARKIDILEREMREFL